MRHVKLVCAAIAVALCLSCADAAFKETGGKKDKVDKTCMPPQSEMDALVLLFHHLGGAEWRKADNWLKGNPCGVGPRDAKNWIGVLCSPCKDNVRHVEVLALEWNNLSGELGPWIGQLPRLQVLNVGTNALTGELPKELGALTRLRVLKIAYNRLTGKLPKELYAAHDLELLDAPYNDLIANLNEMLTAFPRMKILNMRGNRGVGGDLGALGPHFAKMKDLKILDCHWNNIGGELPAELFSMPNLQELALSNNDLSGSLPASMDLPKLKVLQLADNYIEGSLPAALGSLPALTQLDLEKNDIEGTVPAEMGQLSKVSEIKLKYNRLSGELPAAVFALPSLTVLDLTANQIAGQLPASVGNCADGACQAAAPLPVVQKLLLGSNRIVSTVPTWIGQLSSLTELSLADNKFYGSIPTEIGSLNGLEVLNLRTNNFSGPVPDSIGQLVNLKVLELHGNKLTHLPSAIGQCGALQTLLLHRNSFAGPIPESIGQLTALKQLSLHSNLFTGSVPNSFGNLVELTDLTVHDNRLDGNPWLRIESNPSVQPYCEDLSEPDGSERKIKYFRTCGTRNDFYVDVLLRENRSEWRETHSNNWEACYGKCRANAEYPHHYEFQRTSRYQDMYEVADKARFAAYVKRMHRKKGPEFDFHPPTFRFPYEYEAWKAEHAKDPSGYWLLKPTISCCGQNIRLIQGPDDPTMPADLGNWIIQRFVHPPMIVQEHKYVLRLFAMVTSFSPLRVYLFPDGDVFYTHDKYSVAVEKQKKRGNFITDYFFTKKQRDFFTTSNQLFDYLHQQGIDTDAIYRDISDVVVKALMVAEPSMRNQERDRISHPESVYEVVGYDIVLDKNHKPYVCEVNTTPNMGLEINRGNDPVVHEEDFEVKTRIMHDCLQITGTIPPPTESPKATQAGCSQIVRDRLKELGLAVNSSVAYCPLKDFSCLSEDDLALLIEFECELQRRGEFELMFPGPNADKYLPLFEHERRENYLNVWWYKTRHPDAPVKRPCATPWSCRYPRVWREGKFATYSESDWERHTWTQNVPGNRWNTEEEGAWPSGKAEKRYILDDGDAFDDLPNYAATDSADGADSEGEPLEDEYDPADSDFGGEDEAEGEGEPEDAPGWMEEAPEGDPEAEMDSYDIPQ